MTRAPSKLWIFAALMFGFAAPLAVKLAREAGYIPSSRLVLAATIVMGLVCIVGAIAAYEVSMAQHRKYLSGEYDTDG